ncbi:MAG: alkaline phosphatase family protein [Burkholderiales bacterium]|nr:alkaline phosphatase family protein [Phycisphaerae bacterium]
MRLIPTLFPCLIASLILTFSTCLSAAAAEPRVLIVSIDGLRPDCALRADMPNLRSLMKEGSFTFWATTTTVAVTLPSHTSMLTGVVVETHGIKGNDDKSAASEKVLVPTIFDLAKSAGLSTGMAAGKSKFSLYAGSVDHKWITTKSVTTDDEVATAAIELIKAYQPRVMLLHLPATDSIGHSLGWGGPEQIATINNADKQLGRVLETLNELNLRDQTTIIVSADHGGGGKTHGGETAAHPSNQTIPWIISGPDVRKNFDLTRVKGLQVRTYDTFATACKVLNITLPEGSDGKAILQAFPAEDLMTNPATQPTTQATTEAFTGKPRGRGSPNRDEDGRNILYPAGPINQGKSILGTAEAEKNYANESAPSTQPATPSPSPQSPSPTK